jgi:uncharacterized Zn finger protein (UPF0148 family)
MPKCKLNNCREEAVPYGKRYCPAHKAAYEAKQREYRKRAAEAPKCPDCGTAPLFGDRVRCPDCQRDEDARQAYYTKQMQFDEAQTVEELKDWIRKYML